MKKSNLILVGALFVYLIFISAIPITFRYKLKYNDFLIVNPTENYAYARHTLKKSELIILQGLTNCTIIPSDSLFVEIEKKELNMIDVIQRTDTLFLTGRQTRNEIPQKIRIFLPTEQKIIAYNSTILLRGTTNMSSTQSYKFELTKSKLFTQPFAEDNRIPQSVNKLEVTGHDDSILDLQGTIRTNSLTVSDVNQFSYGDRFSSTDVVVNYNNKALVESKGHEGAVIVTGR